MMDKFEIRKLHSAIMGLSAMKNDISLIPPEERRVMLKQLILRYLCEMAEKEFADTINNVCETREKTAAAIARPHEAKDGQDESTNG